MEWIQPAFHLELEVLWHLFLVSNIFTWVHDTASETHVNLYHRWLLYVAELVLLHNTTDLQALTCSNALSC